MKTDLLNVERLEDSATPIISATDKQHEQQAFPIEIFPQSLQNTINEINDTLGFDKDYLAMGMLTCASTMIGNSLRMRVKNGWIVPANIFAVVIGNSSKKKSPALKFTLSPISKKQQQLNEVYQIEKEKWEHEKALEDKSTLQEFLDNNPEPSRKRLKVGDVTKEALCRLLSENTNGLLMFRDEVLAWVNSFNQYRSGSDGQFYLSMFDGNSEDTDRVDKSTYVENPFLSVIGGIQPSKLADLVKDNRDSDGFLYRLLFVYPSNDKPVYMTEKEASEEIFDSYNGLMQEVYNRATTQAETKIISFEPKAYKAFVAFNRYNIDLAGRDEELESLYAKLEGYIPRLALILQVLYDVENGKPTTTVTATTFENTIYMIEYFRHTAHKVLKVLQSDTGLSGKHLQLYEALPKFFTTSEISAIGKKECGYSDSNIRNRIIKKFEKMNLIKRSKQGSFEKLK